MHLRVIYQKTFFLLHPIFQNQMKLPCLSDVVWSALGPPIQADNSPMPSLHLLLGDAFGGMSQVHISKLGPPDKKSQGAGGSSGTIRRSERISVFCFCRMAEHMTRPTQWRVDMEPSTGDVYRELQHSQPTHPGEAFGHIIRPLGWLLYSFAERWSPATESV